MFAFRAKGCILFNQGLSVVLDDDFWEKAVSVSVMENLPVRETIGEEKIMSDFKELTSGNKPFKKAYVAVMLWFVGRAIQAASRVDKQVKSEFEKLPEGFTFCLGVLPNGPYMIIGKNKKGRVKYLGWKPGNRRIDLTMKIKSLEAAILMFTFQESTAVATARDRIIVDGEVPHACAIVRVLDIGEVYLLPKCIAVFAVKRYPVWSFGRKYVGRIRIYFRSIVGY